MAKLLTCEVALSDGTKQYYALESYVMQCLLKMAGCTAPIVTARSDNFIVLYDNGVYTFPVTSSSKAKNVAWIVAYHSDSFFSNLEKNALSSTVLNGNPTLTEQDCVTVAPVIKWDETGFKGYSVTVEDVVSYNTGTLPTEDTSEKSSVISVLHAHIRYRLAIMDDDKFKTLVEAWKTCIEKTLSGLPVTFSNEAVQ